MPESWARQLFIEFVKAKGTLFFFHCPGVPEKLQITDRQLKELRTCGKENALKLKQMVIRLESESLIHALKTSLNQKQIKKLESITQSNLKDLTDHSAKGSWQPDTHSSSNYLWATKDKIRSLQFEDYVDPTPMTTPSSDELLGQWHYIQLRMLTIGR